MVATRVLMTQSWQQQPHNTAMTTTEPTHTPSGVPGYIAWALEYEYVLFRHESSCSCTGRVAVGVMAS